MNSAVQGLDRPSGVFNGGAGKAVGLGTGWLVLFARGLAHSS